MFPSHKFFYANEKKTQSLRGKKSLRWLWLTLWGIQLYGCVSLPDPIDLEDLPKMFFVIENKSVRHSVNHSLYLDDVSEADGIRFYIDNLATFVFLGVTEFPYEILKDGNVVGSGVFEEQNISIEIEDSLLNSSATFQKIQLRVNISVQNKTATFYSPIVAFHLENMEQLQWHFQLTTHPLDNADEVIPILAESGEGPLSLLGDFLGFSVNNIYLEDVHGVKAINYSIEYSFNADVAQEGFPVENMNLSTGESSETKIDWKIEYGEKVDVFVQIEHEYLGSIKIPLATLIQETPFDPDLPRLERKTASL